MLAFTCPSLPTGALSVLSQCLASPFASQTTGFYTAPLVDLGYARYRGAQSVETNVTSFLGIRFAAAPEGDLRWSAPQYPMYEEGLQDATYSPPMCYQAPMGVAASSPWLVGDKLKDRDGTSAYSMPLESRVESEDCLFLNVYVPEKARSSKSLLPVMVWFHGGGHILGDATTYDGGHLVVKSDHNVIVVNTQFRLGLFGFLAGKEVKNGGRLNVGLLDQEFALEWVQKHIHKFGGDPNQVTIWGLSAGAGSVLQQVIAHDGLTYPPLFERAITSSLFLPPQHSYDHRIPQTLYDQIVTQAHCSREENTLKCLRSTDAATLSKIGVALTSAGFYGSWTFAPVVDGEFIVQSVSLALKQGKTNGAAVLSSANSNEGFALVDPNTNYSAAEYTRHYFPTLSVSEAEWIGAAYTSFGDEFSQSSQVQAEAIFVCPTLRLVESFTKSGKPAWKGQFDITPGLHGQDLTYHFEDLNFLVPPPPVFAADNFVNSFSKPPLNFAVFSDPNRQLDQGVNNPFWPHYLKDPTGVPLELYFGQSTSDGTRADIHLAKVDPGLLERCSMWAELADRTGQ